MRLGQIVWALADVLIDGDDEAQQGIRFNIFPIVSLLIMEKMNA
jgi:trehalose/maltose hydrolase-like predicted phosphorylase